MSGVSVSGVCFFFCCRSCALFFPAHVTCAKKKLKMLWGCQLRPPQKSTWFALFFFSPQIGQNWSSAPHIARTQLSRRPQIGQHQSSRQPRPTSQKKAHRTTYSKKKLRHFRCFFATCTKTNRNPLPRCKCPNQALNHNGKHTSSPEMQMSKSSPQPQWQTHILSRDANVQIKPSTTMANTHPLPRCKCPNQALNHNGKTHSLKPKRWKQKRKDK